MASTSAAETGNVARVTDVDGSVPKHRITAKGQATRDRMIAAAADLMYVRGVNAVTLDDIREATATSKSQLYKHFGGKPELIRAVVEHRAAQILAREQQRLQRFKSMSGLRRWRDALVQGAALQGGAYGCALGSMAIELADQDEQARSALSRHFASWEGLLADGFRRMQDNDTLSADADPDALATGLMAALQGGYLLAKANHDAAAMATALDMALAQIESLTRHGGGPEAVKTVLPVSLTAAKLRSAISKGALVLDARGADDFASAQLRGSLNIGFAGSLSSTAAEVCNTSATVAVVVYPGEEQLAAQRLSEMGFTDVAGFYPLTIGASFPAKLADLVQSTPRTSPEELRRLLDSNSVTVVDVRGNGDRDCGTIDGALEIPLDGLRERVDTIPTGKPIVVHCAAGGRSSVAASLLRAYGVPDVSDLTGGFASYERRPRRKAVAKARR